MTPSLKHSIATEHGRLVATLMISTSRKLVVQLILLMETTFNVLIKPIEVHGPCKKLVGLSFKPFSGNATASSQRFHATSRNFNATMMEESVRLIRLTT